MSEWVYNTLYLESRSTGKLLWCRNDFSPTVLGGDFASSRMEHVDGPDGTIDMYSFRTAKTVTPEELRSVSERWPGVRFTLIYETINSTRLTGVGYIVATDGICRDYWGSLIRANGAPLKPPEDNPFSGLGKHTLTYEGYVRWLRQEGISPCDPMRESDASRTDFFDTDDDW